MKQLSTKRENGGEDGEKWGLRKQPNDELSMNEMNKISIKFFISKREKIKKALTKIARIFKLN